MAKGFMFGALRVLFQAVCLVGVLPLAPVALLCWAACLFHRKISKQVSRLAESRTAAIEYLHRTFALSS